MVTSAGQRFRCHHALDLSSPPRSSGTGARRSDLPDNGQVLPARESATFSSIRGCRFQRLSQGHSHEILIDVAFADYSGGRHG